MSDPGFDEETLLEEARHAAGLSDFGSDEFREPLRVLIETFGKPPFGEPGRRRARRRLLQLLTTRLRVQAALCAHPEIRDRKIVKPVVLTGLPRSGTSALFNLLATDPAARPLLMWETQFPDPAEGLAAGEPDPRRAAIEAYQARSREKNGSWMEISIDILSG